MMASTQLAASDQNKAIHDELEEVRAALANVASRCSMFQFTGGAIPIVDCSCTALRGLSRSNIIAAAAERYLASLDKLTEFLLEIANSCRPRTLRARNEIVAALEQRVSRIRTLEMQVKWAMAGGA